MKLLKKLSVSRFASYCYIAVLAVCLALVYDIFIIPNDFVPVGINGILTMIQYLFHFRLGYLSLLVNLPMLVVAFFVLDRSYALHTLVMVIVFSLTDVVLGQFDLSGIVFYAPDTEGGVLAAVAAGVLHGAIYSCSVRAGGCTGGTDVLAAFIHRRYPEFDTVWIIFALNVVIAGASFFVYGNDYRAVFLSLIFVFLNSRVGDAIFKGTRSAAKFEVVTSQPEALSAELIAELRHGCTVLPARGMYTNSELSLLVCVVNRNQIVAFENILRKYSGTFAYVSTVNGTIGNFIM